ncbi:arrestin domain-containing protein 17-like [Neocloeon triangulifer]|uniref:arrestin domain-containing protein 17-like n=1 Tax=Neocloeon triangulifer TaxID=2078957 RepID=UPI00286EFB64|nr:arrestin domain-containing protein 17-like [Neocloeon triangulifer]
MGLEKFQIFFDLNPAVFYSGRIVTGRIVVVTSTPKKLRGIYVKIKGESHVRWTTRQNKHTRVHQAFENYFNNKFAVFGRADGEETLEPGEYSFPFYYTLPKNLPSSFEGDFGFIRYTLKAVMERPWKFDHKAKVLFTVICPLDLNSFPHLLNPVVKQKVKKFCCFCCNSGPVKIVLSIPTGGGVPGETLLPTLDVENNSRVNLNRITLKLIKWATYKAASGLTRDFQRLVVVQNLGRLASGQSSTFERAALTIPALPPSCLWHCNIINLDYIIEVSFTPSGCHRKFKVRIPLVVGTIPLRQNFPLYSQVLPNPPPRQSFAQFSEVPPVPPVHQNLYSEDPTNQPLRQGLTPQSDAPPSYADLAPPSYEESVFGAKNVFDDSEDRHTFGERNFAPLYPVYYKP